MSPDFLGDTLSGLRATSCDVLSVYKRLLVYAHRRLSAAGPHLPLSAAAIVSVALCVFVILCYPDNGGSDEWVADCPSVHDSPLHDEFKRTTRALESALWFSGNYTQTTHVQAGGDGDSVKRARPSGTWLLADAHSAQSLRPENILRDHMVELLRPVETTSHSCHALQHQVSNFRINEEAATHPAKVLDALATAAIFEPQLRAAFTFLKQILDVLQKSSTASAPHHTKDMMDAVMRNRLELSDCALRLSRDVRLISRQISTHMDFVAREHCFGSAFASLECLALTESERESNDGVVFHRGLLMGEAAMAPTNSIFFEGPPQCCTWCGDSDPVDADDQNVPRGLVLAEALLARGYVSAGSAQRNERVVLRVLQLCRHASLLTEMHAAESAVESRYRLGAAIAAENGRQALAANVLAKLSSFQQHRGRHEDALDSADSAMTMSSDPLAAFHQVRLRFALQRLATGDDVLRAASQLASIQHGGLSSIYEEERTALSERLMALHMALEGASLSTCLSLGDVAHVFACALGKLLYA
eukprot:TRINITY_DN9123_c1_g5_i1.p1 TRINITY_DN9123_c1_g5~~TRINITY_DN9123_c1_g5_i1.p1  ORF type:complete len:531 (+),score=101.85 TRINITY_DN9123_c1_g5_i1:82-1674(+)